MSDYAYRDKNKTQIVYADECTIEDVNSIFYCKNIQCNAQLFLRAIKSTTSTHFVAFKAHPHIENCYARNDGSFSITSYDEESFNFENSMQNIMSGVNVKKTKVIDGDPPKRAKGKAGTTEYPKPIETVSQIYKMCKELHPNKHYNGVPIWQMLYDDRNNGYLKKGIWGYHLVECSYVKYNKTDQYIYLKYPINDMLANKYTIILTFKNLDDFNNLNKKLYNQKNLPIVIAGNFKKVGYNQFATEINSGRQIYIPKSQY